MLCRSFEDASVLQVDSGFPIQGMDKKRRGLGDWLCQRTEPRLSKKLVGSWRAILVESSFTQLGSCSLARPTSQWSFPSNASNPRTRGHGPLFICF